MADKETIAEPVMGGSVAAWFATIQQEKREKERENEVE
jgi:hypothetical protein